MAELVVDDVTSEGIGEGEYHTEGLSLENVENADDEGGAGFPIGSMRGRRELLMRVTILRISFSPPPPVADDLISSPSSLALQTLLLESFLISIPLSAQIVEIE